MVKLFCALVGAKGNAFFSVTIDASESVDDLKKAIKKENEDITCAARKVELFLARMGDNTWLDRSGAEAVTLDENGHPEGFAHMDELNWIEDYYGEEFQPKRGEIHVLVVVPSSNKKQCLDWRSTRWGSHTYDPNSLYFVLDKEDVDESGLPPVRMMLYCRPTFHRQFEFLRERVLNEGHLGWILGPPGTGKSTTAMAFASTVKRSEWMVTWIHVEKDMDLECVRLVGEERMTRTIEIGGVNEVLQIDNNKKHLLLVDGWTAADSFVELTTKCHRWLRRDLVKRRLAFVCSVASRGKVQEGTDIRTRAMEFDVWSWTLDEYLDAIRNREFFLGVAALLDAPGGVYGPRSPIEMVESKYHYAGGSCRYMFDCTTTDVKDRLCRAVESASNAATLSTDGHRSPFSINRLYAMFKRPNWEGTMSPLISQYAATTVAILCGPEAIKKFMSMHRDSSNPALNGWMLEMVFFASLRNGGLTLVDATGNTVDTWGQSVIVVSDAIPPIASAHTVWIKPEKWNQGGYDAIMVCKRTRHVRLVQVTSAHKHSFRIEHFYGWLKMLSESPERFEVETIEIIFVAEQDKLSAFHFTTVTGDGLLVPFGWPKGKETGLVRLVGIRGLYSL
ncbi:hypothetical protein PPTG_07157 [Phytophthora nicotianae INRA-310]|uniref:Crinkler effector protein N-terminal domain-containing protein n=4 Tax=Phytophthora nicotianae TaxID=4792 RepID=W2QP72_PHYN3|nr:hypothetical protein PPTG_07157 [Phytophthora nicotianae INRA-310]ETN14908.1 hypothetical protein PPTG_07157 [Phytophthora nicotianae INRA-310]